jgi:hypothetical protein
LVEEKLWVLIKLMPAKQLIVFEQVVTGVEVRKTKGKSDPETRKAQRRVKVSTKRGRMSQGREGWGLGLGLDLFEVEQQYWWRWCVFSP